VGKICLAFPVEWDYRRGLKSGDIYSNTLTLTGRAESESVRRLTRFYMPGATQLPKKENT